MSRSNVVQENLIKILILIGASLTSAIALNDFLVPGNIMSAGLNGISQILSALLAGINIHINTGWFILLFNIPIGVLGWLKVGRGFTLYSILVAIFTSVLSISLPITNISDNPLLAALFGGILTGVGVAYALKYGFSTGGMDIVAVVLQRTTGRSIGTMMMMINILIIVMAGLFFGWEKALYTIISIYAMSRVVDGIYTSHQKMTAFVVTQLPDEVIDSLNASLNRGITIMPAKGAFNRTDAAVLMVVLSRYELYTLEQAVRSVDENAFVNFMNTVDIAGNFQDEINQSPAKRRQLLRKKQP